MGDGIQKQSLTCRSGFSMNLPRSPCLSIPGASSAHPTHIRIFEFLFLLSLTEDLCSLAETQTVFENRFPKEPDGYSNGHPSRDDLSEPGTNYQLPLLAETAQHQPDHPGKARSQGQKAMGTGFVLFSKAYLGKTSHSV